MRVSLALLAYAAVLATGGAHVLGRARWVDRAPRLGIVAWQALAGSVLGSVVLAGLVLSVPTVPVASGLAGFLHACVQMIQAQYVTPAGAVAATAGLALAGAVSGRVLFCLIRAWRAAAAQRRRHLHALAVIGRYDHRLGAVVVDHQVPAVYCAPGRRGRIVLTSAALDTLGPAELAAVLAHERAHQRARHHLPVTVAGVLADAFPRVSAFALGHEQIARLVELAADDTAVRGRERLTLATGILAVAGGHSPAGALGAGGSTGSARVRRLLAPRRRLGALRAALVTGTVAASLALPLMLAGAPAVAAADATACPLPPPAVPLAPPPAT